MPTVKVISFSLWGNEPIYNQGAVENAKMAPFVYPDWKCWFYVDYTVPTPTIDSLRKYGANIIDMTNVWAKDDYHKLFWRYLPISDNTIERFISRDCDSRIGVREYICVQEWIDSGLPFHLIRDSEWHGLPIQGGMWGATPCIEDIKGDIDHFLSRYDNKMPYKGNYMVDQVFLNNILWPKIKDIHICHSETVKFTGQERPFKVPLSNGMHIGQIMNADSTICTEGKKYT